MAFIRLLIRVSAAPIPQTADISREAVEDRYRFMEMTRRQDVSTERTVHEWKVEDVMSSQDEPFPLPGIRPLSRTDPYDKESPNKLLCSA